MSCRNCSDENSKYVFRCSIYGIRIIISSQFLGGVRSVHAAFILVAFYCIYHTNLLYFNIPPCIVRFIFSIEHLLAFDAARCSRTYVRYFVNHTTSTQVFSILRCQRWNIMQKKSDRGLSSYHQFPCCTFATIICRQYGMTEK